MLVKVVLDTLLFSASRERREGRLGLWTLSGLQLQPGLSLWLRVLLLFLLILFLFLLLLLIRLE